MQSLKNCDQLTHKLFAICGTQLIKIDLLPSDCGKFCRSIDAQQSPIWLPELESDQKFPMLLRHLSRYLGDQVLAGSQ